MSVVQISIGHGRFAQIDAGDVDLVSAYKWRLSPNGYVVANRRRSEAGPRGISLHRLILGAQPGQWVDHADHNPLNNTRANIRLCTPSQNAMNRRGVRGAVQYRGVIEASDGAFCARIQVDGSSYELGRFADPKRAARAYDAASRLVHGDFGKLNFPADPAVDLGKITRLRTWHNRGDPPEIAHLVVDSDEVVRRRSQREAWLLAQARLEAERHRIGEANNAVLEGLDPRVAQAAEAFLRTLSYARTGEHLGISRERARQLIARAIGAGLTLPPGVRKGTPRYSEAFRRAVARLAACDGVLPTAQQFGISYSNVRAWMSAFEAHWLLPPGKPKLEIAEARDWRLSGKVERVRRLLTPDRTDAPAQTGAAA